MSNASVLPFFDATTSTPRRMGLVRADGRAWLDDGGEWLPFGTSLFWACHGVDEDAGLLDETLGAMTEFSGGAFDTVRNLIVVPNSYTWAHRYVDPFAGDLTSRIVRMLLFQEARGYRSDLCIFGVKPDGPSERRRIVQKVIDAVKQRPQAVLQIEIVNEGQGFSVEEIWSLARMVREQLPHLVALSAPENNGGVDALYRGSPGTALTSHPDRDTNPGSGGQFRPTRQPYGERFAWGPTLPGGLGEPRGPQSSITWTTDPTVLCADRIVAAQNGYGYYCLHVGAGIYGVENTWVYGTRPREWWKTTGLRPVVEALARLQTRLPADLPRYDRWAHANPNQRPTWPFVSRPGQEWDAAFNAHGTRGYVCWRGEKFHATALTLVEPLTVTTDRPTTFRVRDVTTYEVLSEHRDSCELTPHGGAVVLEGTQE